MSERLDGKVAIVTGAASGIGRAIARRFAAEGAQVIVADVTRQPREGGEPTLELVRAAGGRADFAEADVASWAAVDRLVAETAARYGRLDVMVNNAAVSTGQRLTETAEADWDRVMAVNLKGVFFGCKRAVQQMLQQQPRGQVGSEARGRIVNISSQHGMIAAPNDLAYGVSKSGVAVAPETLAYATARTPLPRLGQPDDVAGAALYLASDEATYMTGVNLMVDGGWMAG